MIRKLFHTNHPSVFLSLLGFALLTRAGYWVYPTPNALEGGYLFDLFQDILLGLGMGQLGLGIVAMFFSFVQALQLNYWLTEQDLASRRTFLPAFFYLGFTGLFEATATFHAPNLAVTLLIPAFNSLMHAKPKLRSINAYFYGGFLLGIAALCYLPATLFLLAFVACLISQKMIHLRAYLVMIISFLMPVYFLWTYFLLSDQTFELSRIIAVGAVFSFTLNNWDEFKLFNFGLLVLISFLGWVSVQNSDISRITNLRIKLTQVYLLAIPSIPLAINSFKGAAYSAIYIMVFSALLAASYFGQDRMTRLSRLLMFLFLVALAISPWINPGWLQKINELLASSGRS